jgi:CRISPR-associated protein Cas6
VLQVSSEAILTLGKRRTLRIREKEVVGHEVVIEGLTSEESLSVQERGLGGRRHMGCGIFVPLIHRKIGNDEQSTLG